MRALVAVLLMAMIPGQRPSIANGEQARDTESVIESVSPPLPEGVTIEVIGWDAFLMVRSDGHAVEIPGYDDEPYMRIDRSGGVFVNRGSQTAVLNGDRYGNVDLTGVTASAEPVWERVGSDGAAMWHDHRSHWMSPKPPATVDERGKVQDFEIPLVVDGVPTLVRGTLYLRSAAAPWWWLLGLAGLATAFAACQWRRRAVAVLVVVLAGAGLVVGAAQWRGLPAGARVAPVLGVFSAIAIVAGLAAVVASRTGRGHLAPVMTTGAAVSMVTAVWLCAAQVRAAHVPGLSSAVPSRVLLPVMLGVGLVTAIDGVMSVLRGSRPAE